MAADNNKSSSRRDTPDRFVIFSTLTIALAGLTMNTSRSGGNVPLRNCLVAN